MADMSNAIQFPPPETKNPVNRRVTRNIRDLLFQRNLKQHQFIAMMGMSQPNINRRIRGHSMWSADEIEKAAEVLQVPITRLFSKLPDLDSNQEPADFDSGYTGEVIAVDFTQKVVKKLDPLNNQIDPNLGLACEEADGSN